MPKRVRRLGRAVVIMVVGVVFGLAGVAGQSVAQTDGMKKDDTMKMDDNKMKAGDKAMKSDDSMMKGDRKGDTKADDTKKDGRGMMKDDKMMQGDKAMEKK